MKDEYFMEEYFTTNNINNESNLSKNFSFFIDIEDP